VGAQVVNWRHTLEQKWATLRFGEVKVVSEAGMHAFEVEVYLGSLDPNSVRVELYANGMTAANRNGMNWARGQPLADANGCSNSARYPRHVPSQTIRRDSSLSATALQSRWRPRESYGSDETSEKHLS